jgi:hypothetical protein
VNSNTKEDNEGCEIYKPQMKDVEDKKQIIDSMVNMVFIFDLEMNNNCKSVQFGMQRCKDDMLSVSVESIAIFTQSLRVLAQSLELWAQSTEKLV